MKRLLTLALGSLLFAVGCQDAGQSAGLVDAPLLVITLDTTRVDALSFSGTELAQTPVIDRLASEGVRFTAARTVAPLTLPSHASLLTGRYPLEHGVRDNGTYQLGDDATTLTEVLGERGYHCGAVVAAPVLNAGYGLAQGFATYRDPSDAPPGPYLPATGVVDRCLEWLRQVPEGRPFFLWAHFFDAHRPLNPPDDLAQRFLAGAPRGMDQLERERRLYAAEVAFIDRELQRLLDAVNAASASPPLIVLTADHGEGNGDHGELAHGYFLYDSTIAVPLLFHHPELAGGTVCDLPVSVVDIAPTLLELLTGGPSPIPSSGASLRPTLQGGEQEPPERPLYFETCYPYTQHRWSPRFGLVAGGYKLVESAKPQLFDLSADPAEARNLWDDPGSEKPREGLRQLLASLRARVAPSSRRSLSEADRAALEAIGYLTGSDDSSSNGDLTPGPIEGDWPDSADKLELIRLHGRASTLAQRGMVDAAAETMLGAVEDDPNNPLFLMTAGQFLSRAGRTDEAIELIQRASVISPEDPGPWRRLAKLQAQRRAFDDAIGSLERLIVADPTDLSVRLELAKLLTIHRQDYTRAGQLLQSFLDAYAEDDELSRQIRDQLKALPVDGD